MTIALRQLTKTFGNLTAVDRIDLDVGEGEVLCLLGPSGCGKTTTLRMIAGLEWATSGDVLLAGQRVNDLGARDRNVAMSFQFYALYPSLNVEENLAYPLHAEGLDTAEINRRVREIAKILQLDHVLHRIPGQLAEGEKQRVAVGRSIVRDAVCFLFDEPLSRLDVQLRETMRGEIKEVLEGLNKPTVIVTHDQLEALTMADRIAVMLDGHIEQVAGPHEIFAKPANLFVAGFIGTPQMNLVPAALIERTSDGVNFAIADQKVTLPINGATSALRAGGRTTLGIRPRAFDLVDQSAADTLTATIDIVEPMGAETLLHLMAGDQELRVVVDRHLKPKIGQTVHLRCRTSQLHVFGADGGRINLMPVDEAIAAEEGAAS